MIKNFKEKTESARIIIELARLGDTLYEITESWTEDMANGDWAAIAKFESKGSLSPTPKEFIVELRLHYPQTAFDGMMYLRKNGSLVEHMGVWKRDIRSLDGWVAEIRKIVKFAGEKLLNN